MWGFCNKLKDSSFIVKNKEMKCLEIEKWLRKRFLDEIVPESYYQFNGQVLNLDLKHQIAAKFRSILIFVLSFGGVCPARKRNLDQMVIFFV